jgi:hypothetical protein
MCALMLKWHREDPVSPKELNRNNAIYAHQKNRNPFIDYPELVEYIWGTKKGQTVNLAALICGYCDAPIDTIPVDTIPVDTIPVVPIVKFGVTWSVNGEVLHVDSIAKDSLVAALPAEPASCSTISTEFMGWTNEPIASSLVDAPAVLYTISAQFPAVTADITYYAVFAQPVDDAYIRHITTCQYEEEVELVPTDEPARKVLVGNHIYLQIGDQLFNLQGQRVK